MIKEEFYFDSRDGESRIHAVRYTPDDGNVKGIVQVVHGMAEYVERYENLAEFLTARGILVTGEDHLGHGKSVAEGGTYGYFCEQDPATVVVRDVHRLKKITEESYPEVPYVILGHSMGSFITRNYLCRYGKGVDGAVIVGTENIQCSVQSSFPMIFQTDQRFFIIADQHTLTGCKINSGRKFRFLDYPQIIQPGFILNMFIFRRVRNNRIIMISE